MTEDQVAKQKTWEREMIDYGVARFRARDAKTVERGNYNEAFGGGRLMQAYMAQVSEHIAATLPTKKGVKKNKYATLASAVEVDKLAMFSLTLLVEAVYKETSIASVCRRLGQFVEDELRFSKFALENTGYFNAITRDLDRKNSSKVTHRRGVLAAKMRSSGIKWKSWSQETAVGVGMQIITRSLEAIDWITVERTMHRGKTHTKLVATEAVKEWIERSAAATALLLPDRMPCLIPPKDWTTPTDGGYYTQRLRSTTPLVKVRWQPTRQKHQKILADADMPTVYKAVNALQRTKWRINTSVLEVMQTIYEKNLGTAMPNSEPYIVPPCPNLPREDRTDAEQAILDNWKAEARELYALEQKRTSAILEVTRTMRIGQMLREHPELYFVYQADFRGRLYCATSGVSPQGADPSRAVLEFATGQTLTERGKYWHKVHGANKYGFDKGSYDERVAFIDARKGDWLAVAADPVGNRTIWAEADKPWSFLAWCLDLARVEATGSSHTAVALDGSCNGLQHFSAMLRDDVGGAAVNLTPSDRPADIYQEVADVATGKLRALRATATPEGASAANWLALFHSLGHDGMQRKLSKKPVMTLPYGSTLQACTSSIFEWLMQHAPKFLDEGTRFKQCVFLSQLLWDSIGEVVVAARAAMGWVQHCSTVLAKKHVPLNYVSPLGFPVFQSSHKAIKRRINGILGGSRMRVTLNTYLPQLDSAKQRQGSAPNLVHHVDATHLMLCVSAGVDEGMQDFAMIHDDFGVHANHVDDWHRIIREQFVALHSEWDVLTEFGKCIDLDQFDLPDPPVKGTLNLDKVLESLYFFG